MKDVFLFNSAPDQTDFGLQNIPMSKSYLNMFLKNDCTNFTKSKIELFFYYLSSFGLEANSNLFFT